MDGESLRAALDMHEIIDDVFMCATEFMRDSSIRMNNLEDSVGKQHDLYLWCLVGGSRNWGSLGLPDAVHERLSFHHQHYRVAHISHSSVSWRPYSGVPFSPEYDWP